MQRTNGLPKGVIFDVDGVLLDSEPFICKAATIMFAEKGLEVKPADFAPFVGAGENRYIGGVAEKYNFTIDIECAKKRTYDIYLEIIKGNLNPLDGAKDFIELCRADGRKTAIASSADMRKVRGNIEEIGFTFDSFDAVVVGEDIKHKKPAPDIFLLAAERMGLSAGECVVVEDAVNGVAAAKAAGSRCLAITSSFGPQQLKGADWFAPNLADVPSEILNWPQPK